MMDSSQNACTDLVLINQKIVKKSAHRSDSPLLWGSKINDKDAGYALTITCKFKLQFAHHLHMEQPCTIPFQYGTN